MVYVSPSHTALGTRALNYSLFHINVDCLQAVLETQTLLHVNTLSDWELCHAWLLRYFIYERFWFHMLCSVKYDSKIFYEWWVPQ
jgi:hypothetical protein